MRFCWKRSISALGRTSEASCTVLRRLGLCLRLSSLAQSGVRATRCGKAQRRGKDQKKSRPAHLHAVPTSIPLADDQALALNTSAWPTHTGCMPQTEPLPLRNEAQLNCVSLRSQLDYEVAWRAVKAQDERSLTTTPLTALQAATDVLANVERK